MTTSRRPRLTGGLLLLAAFGAGIAAGQLWNRVGSGTGLGHVRVMVDAPNPLLDKLRLTAEQRRQAEAILARRSPRTEAMMFEVSERMRLIADSLHAELRSILTPEQQVRLDSLRWGQRLLLKRKVVGPGGSVTTDTVFSRPDTVPRP
jgi:hypothetical protein